MLQQGHDRSPFGSVECASLSDARTVSGRRTATHKRAESEGGHPFKTQGNGRGHQPPEESGERRKEELGQRRTPETNQWKER